MCEPVLSATPRRAPPSRAQRRLWFLQQLEPARYAYNELFGIKLSGALDVGALLASCASLMRRHEVLRTSFVERDGALLQHINDDLDVQVPRVDLRRVKAVDRDAILQRACAADVRRP